MKKRQLADKVILYIKDKVKIFHGCFYQARATNHVDNTNSLEKRI